MEDLCLACPENMNVYRHLDYRKAIVELVEERKQSDASVTFARIAEAALIEKTYISKVIKAKADFNADQLYSVCSYLRLSQDERNYLLLLLEYQRCALSVRKRELKDKIVETQSKHLSTRKFLQQTQMVSGDLAEKYLEYYLDPLAPIIHTYLSIPACQSNVTSIQKRIGITEGDLKRALEILLRLGIVEHKVSRNAYVPVVDNIQLAKESPLCLPSEILFRLQVIDQIKKLPPDQRFLLSMTFSGREETRTYVHEQFLKFLKSVEPVIRDAPSENVFQMNFDLFNWDRTT